VSGSDSSSDGSTLVLVIDTLSSEESGSSLRALEDDGGVDGSGSLEDGVDGGGGGDVDGRDGVLREREEGSESQRWERDGSRGRKRRKEMERKRERKNSLRASERAGKEFGSDLRKGHQPVQREREERGGVSMV